MAVGWNISVRNQTIILESSNTLHSDSECLKSGQNKKNNFRQKSQNLNFWVVKEVIKKLNSRLFSGSTMHVFIIP